jgi:putative phosphotransacetylase
VNEKLVETVTAEVLRQLGQKPSVAPTPGAAPAEPTFEIGISNRHIHLSKEHMKVLFGEGKDLTVMKELIQPGQFAAHESVAVVGPKGMIPKVRIVGPLRNQTQVEIARTDAVTIGIDPPVRCSGDLKGSAPCALIGPQGMVLLDEGVIIAQRHVHLEPERASRLKLKDKDVVKVAFGGEREGILGNFIVRCGPGHKSEIHVDTDEANALAIRNKQNVRLIY